ncbi:MAG: hypothetical protein ACTSXY_12660 [Promethearchaeota archaeon]
MKIVQNSPFLFGKIKIWEQPIFDLIEIKNQSLDFKIDLEEILDLSLSKPFIKPPHPRTILGKLKETIRFDFGIFNSNQIPRIFKKIGFGFGERGYYYDVYMKNGSYEFEDFKNQLESLYEIIHDFESKIENDLENYYFPYDFDLNQLQITEISNYEMMIQFEKPFLHQFAPILSEISNIVEESSEPIIYNKKNISFPRLQFNIISQSLIDEQPLFAKSEKFLENSRNFIINSINPKKNIWQIVARGIPIKIMIKTLEKIL